MTRRIFSNLNHGVLYAAYNTDTRRMADDDITLTGGGDNSGSAAISKMLHSARIAAPDHARTPTRGFSNRSFGVLISRISSFSIPKRNLLTSGALLVDPDT